MHVFFFFWDPVPSLSTFVMISPRCRCAILDYYRLHIHAYVRRQNATKKKQNHAISLISHHCGNGWFLPCAGTPTYIRGIHFIQISQAWQMLTAIGIDDTASARDEHVVRG